MAQKTYNTGLTDTPADQRPTLGTGHGSGDTGVDRETNIEIGLFIPRTPENGTTAKINATAKTVDIPATLSGDSPDIQTKLAMVGATSGAVSGFSVALAKLEGAPDGGGGAVGTLEDLPFNLASKQVRVMADGSIPEFVKATFIFNPDDTLGPSEVYTNTLQSSLESIVLAFVSNISQDLDDSIELE